MYNAQTYKKPKLTKIQIQHRNILTSSLHNIQKKKHSFHLNYILYSNSINNKQTRTNTQLLSATLNVIDPISNQGLIAFPGGA